MLRMRTWRPILEIDLFSSAFRDWPGLWKEASTTDSTADATSWSSATCTWARICLPGRIGPVRARRRARGDRAGRLRQAPVALARRRPAVAAGRQRRHARPHGRAEPGWRAADRPDLGQACERIDAVVARHPEVFAALAALRRRRPPARRHRRQPRPRAGLARGRGPPGRADRGAGAGRLPRRRRAVHRGPALVRLRARPVLDRARPPVRRDLLAAVRAGPDRSAQRDRSSTTSTTPRSATSAAPRPRSISAGTEAWSFGGYLRFAWSRGPAGFARMARGYWRFVRSLWHARRVHRSVRVRRTRAPDPGARASTSWRPTSHVSRELLGDVADLARSPMTTSTRRLAALLMVDRFLLVGGRADRAPAQLGAGAGRAGACS